ncbi:hypothetical protein SAMN05421546_1219 [Solilutibacter tolerans]|uniref:YcgL domain-containing protein SAMN05421546_1219 n=2 Tax=Solilutibacter tolerans TaxID=1604334 RepID=A0A1N6S941_9GAMM|nr:hypothetical protein SAMN05421546_1219 [Lysobacter tolerans]
MLHMLAYVYKSQKRADTYVFLADRDDFARLPESLRTQLGALTFVMELELTPDRKLARENAAEVMQNLGARGFHLQFPPSTAVDPLSEDWGTDA